MSKKNKILIALGVFAVFFISMIVLIFIGMGSVSKTKDEVSFEIKTGSSKLEIVEDLKNEKIIKSKYSALVYLLFNKRSNLQAGNYVIDRSKDMRTILKDIASGKVGYSSEVITVKFVEGKRITEYAKVISENFPYEYDEVIAKIKDIEYIKELISKYAFLTNDILNEDLYYPLEGYLFPDTYEFYKNAKLEDVIEKLVLETGYKLSKLQDNIKSYEYSYHELLTRASIVEMEAMNATDRRKVAQVINKRIEMNHPLQMDVTTYYATQKKMTESLKKSELAEYNAYNTRAANFIGLPVGPICSPSLESITAVLNPSETDYFYFHAYVKTGQVAFFGYNEGDEFRAFAKSQRKLEGW